MIAVPEVVKKLIKKIPFIEESISEGFINLSSLARKLKPQIENELMKEVTEGSVIMALKRIEQSKKRFSPIKKAFSSSPDILVRSNLFSITVKRLDFTPDKHKRLLDYNKEMEYFLTISQSEFETTITGSEELQNKLKTLFSTNTIIVEFHKLSSITIRLTKNVSTIHGVYYHILKTLAWEGINMIELISTYTELTIILSKDDIEKAFSRLKELFED
ncbi:MAG: aspartate kinase [Candidatus Roizmanbacteria bacterium]